MDDKELAERQVLYVCGFTEDGLKPGSFTGALISAVFKADYLNRNRLKQYYPEIVAAVEDYMFGDLYARYVLKGVSVDE